MRPLSSFCVPPIPSYARHLEVVWLPRNLAKTTGELSSGFRMLAGFTSGLLLKRNKSWVTAAESSSADLCQWRLGQPHDRAACRALKDVLLPNQQPTKQPTSDGDQSERACKGASKHVEQRCHPHRHGEKCQADRYYSEDRKNHKIKPIATTGPLRRKIFMGIRSPDSHTLHLVWNCDGGGSGVRVAISDWGTNGTSSGPSIAPRLGRGIAN
jgi:hypothetical protein